ncbi:MAG: hypothetical protein C4331_05090 [Meiothermus sp.]
MGAVLEKFFEGDFEGGWSCYQALRNPSFEDDRIAALCLLNLQQVQQAKNLLLKARAKGCETAAIELATTYRILGQEDLGKESLGRIEIQTLSGLDKVMALREWGAIHLGDGNLAAASEALERAWEAAYETPFTPKILASIGQLLGWVYSERGRDRQATDYLDTALQSANPAKSVYIRTTRALCLSYLGRFEEAHCDLEAAKTSHDRVPLAIPFFHYVWAELERARGSNEQALDLLQKSVEAARRAQDTETECYAELNLCALETAEGKLEVAQAHLARAKNLIVNEKAQSYYWLRQGALHSRAGKAEAGMWLERATQTFERLGLDREAAWGWLHLAEWNLRSGQSPLATEALSKAAQARYAIGSGFPLLIELRYLPRLAAHLSGLPEDAYGRILYEDLQQIPGQTPVWVEVRTLGQSQIVANGKRVRLDMRRSVEVLSYLLAHPGSSLEQILLMLFPDESPDSARNYFHQVRYDLARAVSGMSVPFSNASKTYSVSGGGLELTWDVAELRQALRQGGEAGIAKALDIYQGPFLPNSDSEWANNERQDIAWSVIRAGLETIEGWFAKGQYEKCLSLAGRLLEIEPYDEALNEYLVRATKALQGEAAARRTVARLVHRFENELGDLPPALDELRREFQRLN